uniref:Alpha-taxilin n=1 Tax=Elaeis guineensis var. tenera TaxID=51953 RepID=A0A8N4IDH0_ELAGV|nr:alpha-taxilin [Elaeis guineensis]
MDGFLADRLPEAAALPDGFVESSCDSLAPRATTADADYKVPLIDLERPEELWNWSLPPLAVEISCFAGVGVGARENPGTCLDFLPERDIQEVRVSSTLSSGAPLEASKNVQSPKDESFLNSAPDLDDKSYQGSAVVTQERLESLCRELQSQNKMLMDECQRVSTEGQNMRSDLSMILKDTVKDVNSKLEEQKDECLYQLTENEMLRKKLEHLADEYALAEQQFAQEMKQKILELQLVDLNIQQQQERSTQDQTQMQLYVEQIEEILATEKNLHLQLADDGDKFQQFQDALLKSNELFDSFKQEMEKMASSVKELKKENEFLKSRCEKSDITLVKLVEEREHMKKQLEKAKNQKEKLESLCRSLQAEKKNRTQ